MSTDQTTAEAPARGLEDLSHAQIVDLCRRQRALLTDAYKWLEPAQWSVEENVAGCAAARDAVRAHLLDPGSDV